MSLRRNRRTPAQVYADTMLGLMRQQLIDGWVEHLCVEWDVSASRHIDDALNDTILFLYMELPKLCIAREEV